MNNQIKCVVFDCDVVLVDSVSSWRTLHSFFGTENHDLLQKFISGEITDQEFMSLKEIKEMRKEQKIAKVKLDQVIDLKELGHTIFLKAGSQTIGSI